MVGEDDRETSDTILGGAVKLIQPRRGYRFSVDAVLLARFVRPPAAARILELGTGCGVIALIVAALYHPREVVALELQAQLAALAARNAALNSAENVHVLTADLRARRIAGLKPETFDYVIANPPFRAAGRGRESPHSSRRIARGGGGADLGEFLAAAARYLKRGGHAGFVFTAARAAELIGEMRARRLEPKRMCWIHPRAGEPATALLIEARKYGGIEVRVEPPLMMYDSDGNLREEVRELLEQMPANLTPA